MNRLLLMVFFGATFFLAEGCMPIQNDNPNGGWGNAPGQAGGPPVWGNPQDNGQAQGYPGGNPSGSTSGGYGTGYPGLGLPSASQILVEILMRQLGLSSQQAMGGAGSIFAAAQSRLSPEEFGQIRNALPGIDQLVSAAPQTSGAGGVDALLGIANSFQSLGMEPTMIGQFVPVIVDYMRGQGNTAALGLLRNAFPF